MPRDIESPRPKFDRLANVKKPTGDPSYFSDVRRAKHIARCILGKFIEVSIGDSDEDSRKSVLQSSQSSRQGRTGGKLELRVLHRNVASMTYWSIM